MPTTIRLPRLPKPQFRNPAGNPCAAVIRHGLTAALSAAFAVAILGSASADCSPETVSLRGEWGRAEFSVEIADTPQLRARGLQGRDALHSTAGMLFLYESAGPASFWMKDTRIPLDMLFISTTGTVLDVHRNAVPYDTTPIRSDGAIAAVLEINGGLSDQFGISEGTEIRHPAFDQGLAAWPCRQAD